MNRKDLQALSRVRLLEAKALLRAGRPDGAYYLAGYAVECALKACIAKQTLRHDFPDKKKVVDSHTHDFRKLLERANLETGRNALAKIDPDFRRNWVTVGSWTEESRYRENAEINAQALIEAIENRKHGVMTWLRRHW